MQEKNKGVLLKMKKIILKTLGFTLLCAYMLSMVASCSHRTNTEQPTVTATQTQAVNPDDDQPAPKNGIEKIYLVKAEKASEQLERLVSRASTLIEKETGIQTEVVVDTQTAYAAKGNHYYVIFGDTVYDQSKALAAKAKANDLSYATTEDSVAIYATTDQLMTIAAEKLFADCVKDGNFAVGNEYAAKTVDASECVQEKWTMNFPAPSEGRINATTYHTGYGMEAKKDPSYMQFLLGATKDSFQKYLKKLESYGYKQELVNEIGGVQYASYSGVLGTNIHLSFTETKYELRVIEDRVSTPLSQFNYKMEASDKTRLYMFKMGFKSEDCFFIHLADNSWIVIDGGYTGFSAGSAYVRDMYQFMLERSNLADGEKLQISCWYLTHAHSDHLGGMYGLIKEYGANIEVHRVIDNTPVEGYLEVTYRAQYEELLARIKQQNPDVMYLKIHTGMVVELADTRIETLFTHEDFIRDYYAGSTTNLNRGSLVSVFNIAGLTFLETADNMTASVYNKYPIEKLTTDVLKIAHHFYDTSLDSLYKQLYNTGKVSYCYNPRLDTTANAANNYQASTMALFGSKYIQGSATKVIEFYRSGISVKMNVINY